MAGLRKLNVANIISGHLKTLTDDRKQDQKKADIGDLFVFYGLPLIGAIALQYFNVTLGSGAAQILTTALSIMAGLLFNLIVLLHSLSLDPSNVRIARFAKEVHDNIAYAIIVSLAAIVPLVILPNYLESQGAKNTRGFAIMNGSAVALSMHFAMTMVMVLKRMYQFLDARLKKE